MRWAARSECKIAGRSPRATAAAYVAVRVRRVQCFVVAHAVVDVLVEDKAVIHEINVVGLPVIFPHLLARREVPAGAGDRGLSVAIPVGGVDALWVRALLAVDEVQQWDKVPLAVPPAAPRRKGVGWGARWRGDATRTRVGDSLATAATRTKWPCCRARRAPIGSFRMCGWSPCRTLRGMPQTRAWKWQCTCAQLAGGTCAQRAGRATPPAQRAPVRWQGVAGAVEGGGRSEWGRSMSQHDDVSSWGSALEQRAVRSHV